MHVVLYRIDDRLIHGQIMTAWSKFTNASQLVIIDDEVAKDEFMQKVMTMAAPRGIKVKIYSIEEGIKVLKTSSEKQEKTLVLVKRPDTINELLQKGIDIKKLNVGGMGAAAGRKPIFKNISASNEEIDIFKEIASQGVEIEFRIVPDDKGIMFQKLIK